jgi:hypothetical protein
MSIEETITRDVLGVLSFVFLIAWLRWEGPWQDQGKAKPKPRRRRERQIEND